MTTARLLARTGIALLALAGLGACAGPKSIDVGDACPPTQIAVPSDRIGHSDEEGNIRYVATMAQLVSSCRRDEDHVELDIAFDLKAERGPAFEDAPVLVTYYIATVDPERQVVDKQLLTVRLEVGAGEAASAVRESLTLRLPASSDQSGANYSLYLGFQPDRQPGVAGG